MDVAMNEQQAMELQVAEQAAEWLERLKTADALERAQYADWLRESPLHVREMCLAACWDTVLTAIDPDQRIDLNELLARSPADAANVSARTMPRVQSQPERGILFRWLRWLLLPSIATVCVMSAVFFGSIQVDRIFAQRYATAIGEQRAIRLTDGSIVHLNTQSQVRVAYSRDARDVYLRNGQATFRVEHNPSRPFRVHVENNVVEAIGTQFDIRQASTGTEVAVLEGRVRIHGDDAATASFAIPQPVVELSAGDAVTLAALGTPSTRRKIDTDEVRAWQQRRLVFRNTTIADIAAEFNRYNRDPQLHIEGSSLSQRRFSGVFDADDPESLVLYLAGNGVVSIRHDRDIVIGGRDSRDP
jgi:transmembrane sensor